MPRYARDLTVAVGWLLGVAGPGCVIPLTSAPPGVDAGGSSSGATASGGDAVAPQSVIIMDGAAPTGTWTNVTNNLANMASACGSVAEVFLKPDEDLLIVSVVLHGLWASADGGGSWHQLGTGAGSVPITHDTSSMLFDPMVPTRYWESGVHGVGGGVDETTDDGQTFTLLGTLFNTEVLSIDFSDVNRQTLIVGGHETSNQLFRSTDGGQTWVNIGAGLPGHTDCARPLLLDSQTYLVGCGGFGGGPIGVYRTTDGGMNWTLATPLGGGTPLQSADGTSIYWMSPGDQGMSLSRDRGQTWAKVVGAGVIRSSTPVELPDGRLAALSTQASVMVSADQGRTWKVVTTQLPFSDASGIQYSPHQKAFYASHFACGNGNVPVPSDAIARYAFDYQKN